MYGEIGISKELIKKARKVEEEIKEEINKVNEIVEYNSIKVIKAFQKYNLAEVHFGSTTGYGYGDIGRDVIENIFADILGTEDSLVRIRFYFRNTCSYSRTICNAKA